MHRCLIDRWLTSRDHQNQMSFRGRTRGFFESRRSFYNIRCLSLTRSLRDIAFHISSHTVGGRVVACIRVKRLWTIRFSFGSLKYVSKINSPTLPSFSCRLSESDPSHVSSIDFSSWCSRFVQTEWVVVCRFVLVLVSNPISRRWLTSSDPGKQTFYCHPKDIVAVISFYNHITNLH